MDISFKIARSLQILGLSSGASASEIRSAFRRLARVCHPDVAGRQGARRFEQITTAYTFLKGLTQEELLQHKSFKSPSAGWKTEPRVRGNPVAWDSGHAERKREERKETIRSARAEAALRCGERAIRAILEHRERSVREYSVQDLILRLSGESIEVRHLAISRLGQLANQPRILDAVTALLSRREIDERTARLVAALPLTPENRKKLAAALTDKSSTMPDALLLFLLQLRVPDAIDRDLLDRYIRNATPGGVTLILRYWPEDSFLSEAALRALIFGDNEEILLQLFGTMKQRGLPCPSWSHERLKTLQTHPNAGVRVWAKVLLSRDVA